MKKNFTKKVRPKGPVFDYQDRFPLVMGAILMAGLCCYYASKVGLLVGMTTGDFYLSYFIFLFFIGSALAYIRWEVRILDEKWNWLHEGAKRFVFQSVYCWLAPSLALFLVYAAAHRLLSTEVLTSGLFEVDLPWIVVLLLLVNLCYTLVFFVQLQERNDVKRRRLLKDYRLVIQALNQQHSNKALLEKEKEMVPQLQANGKSLDSIYEVRTQKIAANFRYGHIVYFSYETPYTYLITTDGQRSQPMNHHW